MDIELYDATQRLRFEHPQVRAVVVTSGKPKIFCAGANIRMLAASPHHWKVNFCKFTNETRNAIEDASEHGVEAMTRSPFRRRWLPPTLRTFRESTPEFCGAERSPEFSWTTCPARWCSTTADGSTSPHPSRAEPGSGTGPRKEPAHVARAQSRVSRGGSDQRAGGAADLRRQLPGARRALRVTVSPGRELSMWFDRPDRTLVKDPDPAAARVEVVLRLFARLSDRIDEARIFITARGRITDRKVIVGAGVRACPSVNFGDSPASDIVLTFSSNNEYDAVVLDAVRTMLPGRTGSVCHRYVL